MLAPSFLPNALLFQRASLAFLRVRGIGTNPAVYLEEPPQREESASSLQLKSSKLIKLTLTIDRPRLRSEDIKKLQETGRNNRAIERGLPRIPRLGGRHLQNLGGGLGVAIAGASRGGHHQLTLGPGTVGPNDEPFPRHPPRISFDISDCSGIQASLPITTESPLFDHLNISTPQRLMGSGALSRIVISVTDRCDAGY